MFLKMTKRSNITQAVTILRHGGLVAFPTETVYGLGADAKNEEAIRKVFKAKGRPYDHPLIVHIGKIEELNVWARDIPPLAMKLARVFWPGPLTLILKKQSQVPDILTGRQDTIGIRIPKHPVALSLLQAFGSGIAAPSANKFTHISPTTAAAVKEELGKEVGLILDGGECEVGLESTILNLSTLQPTILRPGMISAQALEEVMGVKVTSSRQDTPEPRVPGMHHLHYAPLTKALLIETKAIPQMVEQLQPQDLPAAFLIYSDLTLPQSNKMHWVRMPPNAFQYAHHLYHMLRTLDNQHYKVIFIESVPHNVEWEAIRDRLLRASGT